MWIVSIIHVFTNDSKDSFGIYNEFLNRPIGFSRGHAARIPANLQLIRIGSPARKRYQPIDGPVNGQIGFSIGPVFNIYRLARF